MEEGTYDLVLIGAEPHGRFYRRLLGELVMPLLRWIDRPLLIAQPPLLTTKKTVVQRRREKKLSKEIYHGT